MHPDIKPSDIDYRVNIYLEEQPRVARTGTTEVVVPSPERSGHFITFQPGIRLQVKMDPKGEIEDRRESREGREGRVEPNVESGIEQIGCRVQ